MERGFIPSGEKIVVRASYRRAYKKGNKAHKERQGKERESNKEDRASRIMSEKQQRDTAKAHHDDDAPVADPSVDGNTQKFVIVVFKPTF